MSARSLGSGTISFGLVTIPIKIYTAASSEGVNFNMLHTCGSRVKQQLRCVAEEKDIEHADTVKGFEYARDQFVVFTADELASMKAARPSMLALEEFVPSSSVDLLQVEKSFYLGPDKGGDQGYAILAAALARADKIGVGRFAKQGKDVLVLLRAYRGGLLMHEAYYAHEVRPWSEIPQPGNVQMGPQHIAMAELLIRQLERPAFEPERFRDEWAEKVRAMVAKKVSGEEIHVPQAPKTRVLDLLEALQASVSANDDTLDKIGTKRESLSGELGPAASAIMPKGPRKAQPRKAAPAPRKRRSGEKG